MYARTSFGPEKRPLLREFFYVDDIHLEIQVPPPPGDRLQAENMLQVIRRKRERFWLN